MRSRNIIKILLTTLAILGAVWVLQSSDLEASNQPCKESMDACSNDKTGTDKMIFENLSQQFFSTF